ncbi:uncharacterized protein NPIL_373031 [Nephila pilipes]|uniref:Chloride channel CLIC-like protein 1 n=1 Tax=Nephila pilipes TaxID=299642 RepID=A0A8X6T513_NEPPI|nr:uncharacterized protein NPIL_373031 [Nephila pilipes]
MYQEKIAEKHNLMENLRHENECRRSELSWYESVSLYFGSYVSQETDCEKYYKAVLVDPFWEVSFPVVIANAVTSVICEPLKVIATTLRICAKELFSGLTLAQLNLKCYVCLISLSSPDTSYRLMRAELCASYRDLQSRQTRSLS